MKVLMIDIDTLRPDHMGCYGYQRETTPNMDQIAAEGVVFENYYTPNAPCLPSRASLCTGMYGIHSGVVGHGGTAADLRVQGESRGFKDVVSQNNLFMIFRQAGYYTASMSTFAERHSAYWFNAGLNEIYNVGKSGGETAEEVTPLALKWMEEHANQENWFLHYHIWDPHTPYRTPETFGNPFEDVPLPDDWITEEVFEEHFNHVGPHSAQEIGMWNSDFNPEYPKHPGSVRNLKEVKNFMDQYDCGIKYADEHIGQLIKKLKALGIYEDTAIIITSDHGENMGELGLYAEHATADEPCCHIPMIIKWPGLATGHRDKGFHLNIDLIPTLAELYKVPESALWDGKSFLKALTDKEACGYHHVVLNQCAHVCQRSVRFEDYLYIRTVHGGYHLFEDEMLFNIKEDPHECQNLTKSHPELCAKGAKYILDWEYEMMKKSTCEVDPMWTVMREGGPYHSRGYLTDYIQRLKETGREAGISKLLEKYPNEKYS